MSLFGLMGDLEEDPIFGQHMRSMRQMNTMMNSIFHDPFGMFNPFDPMGGGMVQSALTGAPQPHLRQQQSMHRGLMPFGFPSMPNINSLLNADYPADGSSSSFSSSRVVTMTQGVDGRPQVYEATSRTKTGPGGVRETQKTVQDSRTGVKKMAIGHHIGERAHVIEREKNYRTGEEEERQDFINLEEEEADDFNREYRQRAHHQGISAGPSSSRQHAAPQLQAIMPSEAQVQGQQQQVQQVQQVQQQQQQQQGLMHQHQQKLLQQQQLLQEQHQRLRLQQQQQQQQQQLQQLQQNSQARSSSPDLSAKNLTTSLANVAPSSLSSPASTPLHKSPSNISSVSLHRRASRNIPSLATPRRPLRTPISSPLALPTSNEYASMITSIHPHPYNASARRGHRSMKSSPQEDGQDRQRNRQYQH